MVELQLIYVDYLQIASVFRGGGSGSRRISYRSVEVSFSSSKDEEEEEEKKEESGE